MRGAAIDVAWYADDCDPAMASVRLRMLLPMRELAALGMKVARYEAALPLDACRAIVFSKSLSAAGLAIAERARQRGCRLVYDICDNCYDARPGRKRERRIGILDAFLALADQVVFSTDTLRQQILARHPGLATHSHVISDMLEPPTASAPRPALADHWRLWRLRRFLDRHAGALHCVWFGKSQGRLAGFVHLDRAVRELAAFSATRPVTLTVISNKPVRYRAASAAWRIPSHFTGWSLAGFPRALALHDVAVIPVERNAYTLGKSINRPATAILAGLGVVADAIDSYEELRPFVFLDDWQAGLAHYSVNPPRRDARLAAARDYLDRHYGGARIARQWQALLGTLAEARGKA